LYSVYVYDYYGEYVHDTQVNRWEEWDIRVLILSFCFAQFFLLVLGSLRKWKMRRRINVIVRLLDLSSEFVSAIALGRLSKLNKCSEENPPQYCDEEDERGNVLRVLWAPTILFYLGGPDTITVSSLGEISTWVRHFIGLLMQGVRISSLMWVAWTENRLSLVALLMLFPGIIKYGEKVWIIWSRTEGHFEGFVQLDDSNIDKARPESELVLRAYSYFQTLKPHNLEYFCDRKEQEKLVRSFNEWTKKESDAKNAFKLIEIELGFMHDMLFNRIGTIFTIWGCIVRFISFSFLVCTFVIFCFRFPPRAYGYLGSRWVDPAISHILLLEAIFLEVAGVVAQLFSDWAVIWASRHQSKLLNPILRLQEYFLSKSKRWSGYMGQCDLLTLCCRNNSTPRKIKCSKNMIKIPSCLKDLIINQLLETWQSNAEEVELEHLPSLAMRRGAWMPIENQNEFKWSIGLEFGESIVTWHIVTEICYRLSEEHDEDISEQVKAIKILSHYMTYLLIRHPSTLPFCNTSSPVMESWHYVKKILSNSGSFSSNAKIHGLLLEEECNPQDFPMIHRVRTLANNLREKEREIRWKIMSNIWLDMLSYAASNCPIRQHAREVSHGGELLTHVWLLLLHLGVEKRLDFNSSRNLERGLEELPENLSDMLPDSPTCFEF
ncbi:hypothetical protein NMG60_11023246, partial [Bertholletia excelsa]